MTCYTQENIFREKRVTMITGNATQYRLLQITNNKHSRVCIFWVKKWIDKVSDISWVKYCYYGINVVSDICVCPTVSFC